MTDLTELPNIGSVLAEKLRDHGIDSGEELARLGSVQAMLRLSGDSKVVGFNMLYALEGAIRRVRWHEIPREELAGLRRAVQEAQGGR